MLCFVAIGCGEMNGSRLRYIHGANPRLTLARQKHWQFPSSTQKHEQLSSRQDVSGAAASPHAPCPKSGEPNLAKPDQRERTTVPAE